MSDFKITKKTETSVLTIRVDKSIIDRFDILAKESNRSRNQLIEKALEYALEHVFIEGNTEE